MPMDGVPAASAPTSAPVQKKTTETSGQAAQGASEPNKDVQENPYKGTKHKLPGKATREVEYDQLLELASKGEGADQKFQEAAKLRKDVDAIMQGLAKGDEQTWEWLEKNLPAPTFKQMVNKYAYKFMEYDTLPDEDKRRMELDERERKLSQAERDRAESEQKKAWESEVQGSGHQLEQLLDQFSERSGKKPNSAELYRITEKMLAHIGKFRTLPDVDILYDRASKELERDTLEVIGRKAQDAKELLQFLPDDVKKQLRKALLDEATAGQPKRYEREVVGDEVPKKGGKKAVGIDDAFARMEKRLKHARR